MLKNVPSEMKSILLLFSFLYKQTNSADILLIFVIPAFSHHSVFKALSNGLLQGGHNLTIVTTIPYKLDGKANIIDLSEYNNIFYKALVARESNENDVSLSAYDYLRAIKQLSIAHFRDKRFQNVIKNGSYDALITEAANLFHYEVLAKHFNIPLIGISSMDLSIDGHEDAGNSFHPGTYPDTRNLPYYGELNFFERVNSLLHYVHWKWIFVPLVKRELSAIVELSGGEHPKYELLLTNAHPALGFRKPLVQNVVDVTGIHVQEEKPLPKTVGRFLDSATNGAILVSLGTSPLNKVLEEILLRKLLKASKNSNRKFIWKCTNKSVKLNENMKCWQWLPQADILRHKNIKLFIFQGGYQSLVESLTFGVPMLVSPLSGDQFMNANKIQHFGVGRKYSLRDADDESFVELINEVIEQSSYKERALEIGRQLRDRPMDPVTSAVWWVEYVLRHGNTEHLRPPQSHLIPVTVYLELAFYFSFMSFMALILCKIALKVVFVLKKKHFKDKKIKRT